MTLRRSLGLSSLQMTTLKPFSQIIMDEVGEGVQWSCTKFKFCFHFILNNNYLFHMDIKIN